MNSTGSTIGALIGTAIMPGVGTMVGGAAGSILSGGMFGGNPIAPVGGGFPNQSSATSSADSGHNSFFTGNFSPVSMGTGSNSLWLLAAGAAVFVLYHFWKK